MRKFFKMIIDTVACSMEKSAQRKIAQFKREGRIGTYHV